MLPDEYSDLCLWLGQQVCCLGTSVVELLCMFHVCLLSLQELWRKLWEMEVFYYKAASGPRGYWNCVQRLWTCMQNFSHRRNNVFPLPPLLPTKQPELCVSLSVQQQNEPRQVMMATISSLLVHVQRHTERWYTWLPPCQLSVNELPPQKKEMRMDFKLKWHHDK